MARVLMLNRTQIEQRAVYLESLLPEGHRADVVWAYVQQADLSRIYAGIKAVEGGCGRTPVAQEILLALWLFATMQGVGSARAIARSRRSMMPIAGCAAGVAVNCHTFTLKRVAQDGMRVRSSAGAVSFWRWGTLEQHLADARAQVATLKRQIESDPAALSRRQHAARVWAAR